MAEGNLIELVVAGNLETYLHVSSLVMVLFFFAIIVSVAWRISSIFRVMTLELDEAEMGVGNQKLKLKANAVDSQVAYKIWVELSTRKIGIPIKLENDVIVEVYDSWYKFFSVTRELIKDIPIEKIRRKETRNIVRLSIDVLNNGVRPHLTSWQAKFRRWYENEATRKDNFHLSPQEIQTKCPFYAELSSDLINVNKKLMKYRDAMYKVAVGGRKIGGKDGR